MPSTSEMSAEERAAMGLGNEPLNDDIFEEDIPIRNGFGRQCSINNGERDFGLLFDIDGVLARGHTPFRETRAAMQLMCDDEGKLKIPVAFVTNGCNRACDKAKQLTAWCGFKVDPAQVIHAQSPLSCFKSYHNRHTLVIGQGPVKAIAADLGFTNVCTIQDIRDSFPLLDMVDHQNRKKKSSSYLIHDFPKVEVIVMFGEPTKWETNLQLIVDLLVTNGLPEMAPEGFPEEHIPILAANMDLVFMEEACMPRFGHGAFLICLESLYQKVTGRPLKYTALVGKPSEITYRYAEHVITKEARKMGIENPITKLYFVGDNPEVDIVGANLYDKYIVRNRRRSHQLKADLGYIDTARLESEIALSQCRAVPREAEFLGQTVRKIDGILVGTGVFDPDASAREDGKDHYRGHRDFEQSFKSNLKVPTTFVPNVLDAVKYALADRKFQIDYNS